MGDFNYNAKDTVYVADGYQHSRVPDPESSLNLILQELFEWIDSLQKDGGYPQDKFKEGLEEYADRVVDQITNGVEDNKTNGRNFAGSIENNCKKILSFDNPIEYKVSNSSVRLEYLLLCVGEIARVYQEGFTNMDSLKVLKDTLYGYIENVNQERLVDLNTYKSFTKSAAEGFVKDYLLFSRDFVDLQVYAEDYPKERLVIYDFLFQFIDEELVNFNCDITLLVSLLVAIQNNRIFPSREDVIIAVGDNISILNFVKMIQFSCKLMREILIENNSSKPDDAIYPIISDLVSSFIQNNDMSLLPEISDAISSLNKNVEIIDRESKAGTDTSNALKGAGNSMFDLKIESYMDLLNDYQSMLNSISNELNKLQIKPNYELLDNALRDLENLADHINYLIQNNVVADAIKDFMNELNEILDAINATNEAINQTLCVIQQALCIIGGWLNFMDTVVGPLLEKLNQLVDDLVSYWDDAVDSVMSIVDLVNKAIRAICYAEVEAKLLAKSQEAAVASGETYDGTWGVNYVDSVNSVILSALGQEGPTIQELTTQTQNKMNDLKNAFVSALSGANCPPIELPNLTLTLPKLNLALSLPKMTQISFDLKC